MVFLDTNIVLRLVDAASPEHDVAGRFIQVLTLNVQDFAGLPGIVALHPSRVLAG